MKYRIILPCCVGTCMAIPTLQAKEKNPNIVLIMTDQQRADFLAREGYPIDTMPFVDELASQGTWFNRAYTSSPASVPARTSLLTGRFPKATHVRNNQNETDAYFEKDLFHVLKENGYATALVGKNHSYLRSDRLDYWSEYSHGGKVGGSGNEKGDAFDRFLKETQLYASFKPSPGGIESQPVYRMVDEATEWIKGVKGKPFMLWLSFAEPHNPYQACEPYFSMFRDKLPSLQTSATDRRLKGARYETLAEMMELGHVGYSQQLDELRSIYLGMMRMIDDQIRRFTDNLKDQNLYENTIFIFVSDHGDYVGEYSLMKKGAGLDEVVSRIPMQWSGPGIRTYGKPHDAHVSMVDIFPTICEIIDAPIPVGVQGRSLWSLLQGKSYPEKEFESIYVEHGYGGQFYTKEDDTDYLAEGAITENKYFFDELNSWTQSGFTKMVRKGDWKLIFDMEGNGQLYNLKKDPMELKNLFETKKYRQTKTELLQDLLKWEIATGDPLPLPRRRYHFKKNEHNYLFKNM
ncbi:MAG: sulfatase-like hydrolase/transferase [Proteiniphilum sp.]